VQREDMSSKPNLPERLGRSLNELDIDFSSFTLVGWIVGILSLLIGGGVAGLAMWLMVRQRGLDVAAGMVFCVTMLFFTTASFIALRYAVTRAGFAITRQR
jgi:hypothetical protein